MAKFTVNINLEYHLLYLTLKSFILSLMVQTPILDCLLHSRKKENVLKVQVNGSKYSQDFKITLAKLKGMKKVLCTDQGNHIT